MVRLPSPLPTSSGQPAVLVTGVSSGIGYAIAAKLLSQGFKVYGSVRKEPDAARLRETFGEQFTPLLFDVTDETAIHSATAQLTSELAAQGLAGLVNNAGIAIAGPACHVGTNAFRRQLEINVLGPISVTSALLPILERYRAQTGKEPRIINISSVSGRFAAPFLAPYAASKFALEAWSDSLRRELMRVGVDVIVVAPASIRTPIWDKAASADATLFDQTPFAAPLKKFRAFALKEGENGLAPEKVAETVWRALTGNRPKARYTVAKPYSLVNGLLPLLPKRFVDRLIARQLGLHPEI